MRKTILKKLPLVVVAMIQARTPNTMELSARLPLDTEPAGMREQWLRRLLTNRLISSAGGLEPFARRMLEQAALGGQTILLSMGQTDLGDCFAVLMISVCCGDRSLPLVWRIEEGEANIGLAGQQGPLEQVWGWLPEGTAEMPLADRFYPSVALFEWLIAAGWQYPLRQKGNLLVDVGCAGIRTTGELAAGVRERYEVNARLFEAGRPTALGVHCGCHSFFGHSKIV